MGIVSRGFGGRRPTRGPDRLPPGQYDTGNSFPVLSAGPTPRADTDRWDFTVSVEREQVQRWTWQQFRSLPREMFTVDIHCVTTWSKFDTGWSGVSVDVLLDGVGTGAVEYAVATCDGGYTTNLPLSELTGGRAWVVDTYDGAPLHPEHGGPARLLVPHLYFWKSAKWVRGLSLSSVDRLGFWERNGYHAHGDPWTEQRYAGD